MLGTQCIQQQRLQASPGNSDERKAHRFADLPERHQPEFAAVTEQDLAVMDRVARVANRLRQPQRVQGAHRVHLQADSGADRAQLGSLLEHLHVETTLLQGNGRGQAANAGTGDEDALV